LHLPFFHRTHLSHQCLCGSYKEAGIKTVEWRECFTKCYQQVFCHDTEPDRLQAMPRD
jgi:hypothetical protein